MVKWGFYIYDKYIQKAGMHVDRVESSKAENKGTLFESVKCYVSS